MIEQSIENHFNEWLNGNLGQSIKTLGSKISERELRSFIANHPKLPQMKRNLCKELSVPQFCLDQETIKYVTVELAKLFTVLAVKTFEAKDKKNVTLG